MTVDDKQRVADGAAALRHAAIQDRYAGAGPPDFAFGLASVLDTLHTHWRDLDGELQGGVLGVCDLLAQPQAGSANSATVRPS